MVLIMFADLLLSQSVFCCNIQMESKASDGGLLAYGWTLNTLKLGMHYLGSPV